MSDVSRQRSLAWLALVTFTTLVWAQSTPTQRADPVRRFDIVMRRIPTDIVVKVRKTGFQSLELPISTRQVNLEATRAVFVDTSRFFFTSG